MYGIPNYLQLYGQNIINRPLAHTTFNCCYHSDLSCDQQTVEVKQEN